MGPTTQLSAYDQSHFTFLSPYCTCELPHGVSVNKSRVEGSFDNIETPIQDLYLYLPDPFKAQNAGVPSTKVY
ncbi:hypothetical protein GBA52_016229 [Prunus armeniaca]|nr:hypothetical protein GBA52_016229 [Prunus armeniaca]